MNIDFSKISAKNAANSVTEPREVFRTLPKKDRNYQYLRDVQSEVLQGWYRHKDQKDVVIKMNTGSGKTLVGLLILKSCLNEGKSPCLYVTPDKYLTKQVRIEADKIGIPNTDDPSSPEFQMGKAVCITYIHRLVNGKSVFGIGATGVKIPLGTVVIDDVHACLSTTESQFTLKIERECPAYKELMTLFKDSLFQQSDTTYLKLVNEYPDTQSVVPFWAWIDNIPKVNKILFDNRDDKSFTETYKFVMPLIESNLNLCKCIFSNDSIEISPRYLPIDVIPSFVKAKRRIFMTATLIDNEILFKDFNCTPSAVTSAIVPSSANDIGERMILLPHKINPDISYDDIKTLLVELSRTYNVSVIVPSLKRAKYWLDIARVLVDSTNIESEVNYLRKNIGGVTVFLNKYDGVDLPDEACRILVLDGIPEARRKLERIEKAQMPNSEYTANHDIQRIEQGMGRGIRSTDDYCAVLLLSNNLIRYIYLSNFLSKFSIATKTQIELSNKMTDQLNQPGKAKPNINDIKVLLSYILQRQPDWVGLNKSELVNIHYSDGDAINDVALKQLDAYKKARLQDYHEAATIIQELAVKETDDELKGWLMQELAEYTHYFDPVKAQEILLSAQKYNQYILKPISGIAYSKIKNTSLQTENCYAFAQGFQSNQLLLHVDAQLELLGFEGIKWTEFEEAFRVLAALIGFKGQRPELATGKGPDVLWSLTKDKYFIVSCKNEAKNATISEDDCNQLSGDINWFSAQYGEGFITTPIIIHPSKFVDKNASPPVGMKVIDSAKLDELKLALRNFAKGLEESKSDKVAIQKLLIHYSFTDSLFIDRYLVNPKLKGN